MKRRFKLDIPTLRRYKLNLGCGLRKLDGVIGIDIKDYGQEIIWDVREGIPMEDNSVEEIFIYHFMEHLTCLEVYNLFIELHRICVKGTIINIHVPPCEGPRGYSPTHLSFWDESRLKGFFDNFPDECNKRIKMFEIDWMARKEDLICMRVRTIK